MTLNEAYVEFKKIYDFANLDIELESFVNVDELMKCPAAPSLDSGVAYDGALLYHTILTYHFARKIASFYNSIYQVNDVSLAKVIVLHQLGKVGMFSPNTNDWEVKKLGKVYGFNESGYCLKTGERSKLLCSNAGITFTPDEYEAMSIMDKSAEEYENMSKYRTILSTIVRSANEVAYKIESERVKLENNNE